MFFFFEFGIFLLKFIDLVKFVEGFFKWLKLFDSLNVCEGFEVEGKLFKIFLCWCKIDEKYFGFNEDFSCLFFILLVEILYGIFEDCLLEVELEFFLMVCEMLLFFILILVFLFVIVSDFWFFLNKFMS